MLIDLGSTFGGVEGYVVNLTQLLQGEIEISVLCVLPDLARRIEAAGARAILLPNLAGPLKPLRFILALTLLPFLLLKHRIDTVQVNGFLESTLMLPARLMGRRTVYTRHGPFELENYRWYRHPLKFAPRALARLSVYLATEVVCVSKTVADQARRVRPPLPVTMIPNWLATQPKAHAVRPSSKDGLVLVCVGRLERYKGVHLAIEAMRGVEGLRLLVVGEGPYRGQLEELAAGLPVEFAGFQEDIQAYLEAADIFVMPSLGPEGMPMSSLEAMGRGLPCILSDLPVHHEISDDGLGAALFRSGEVASLRSSLLAILSDVKLRRSLATTAYQIVKERYTEESVRLSYLKVFCGR